MLYSGFIILPRSVIRRQTGFAARITRTLCRLEAPLNSQPFLTQYDLNREIWQDCYIGFLIEPHSMETVNRDTVVAHLADRPIPMPFGGPAPLSRITPESMKTLSLADGLSLAETMLTAALNYSSNFDMPAGEPEGMSTSLFSNFTSPQIFANTIPGPNSRSPVTGHTLDVLICCADDSLIGCLLTCEEE